MSPRLEFDEAWLADYQRRTGKQVHDYKKTAPAEAKEKPKRRSKYNAQPTNYNGKRYASKKEAARAADLTLLRQGHQIAGFAEQVEFHLPGGIKYRADFVLLNFDGTFEIEDTKGVQTPEFKLKKRLMAEQGLEIKVI